MYDIVGKRNWFFILSGVLILLGIAPNPYVIAIGTFLTFFAMPVINANSQAIWQTKVEPDVQGRVFSVRHTIAFISIPLAFVTAGPMADYFFEPLMAKGGPLALGIGQNLGTGPGRGIGLMCIIYAGIVLLVTLLSAANPRMLNVEQELPDAVQD